MGISLGGQIPGVGGSASAESRWTRTTETGGADRGELGTDGPPRLIAGASSGAEKSSAWLPRDGFRSHHLAAATPKTGGATPIAALSSMIS